MTAVSHELPAAKHPAIGSVMQRIADI